MADPLCKYFGRCGGCSSQHIDYSVQLENKRLQLERAVGNTVTVFSGQIYSYRNRMDFIFHEKGLGFRQKRKWYIIVDVEECKISNSRLNLLLKEVRDFFVEPDFFDVKKKSGTFRYALIRTPQNDSCISFVLNSDSPRLAQAVEQIKRFSQESSSASVLVAYVGPCTDSSVSDDFFVVKGSEFLSESFLGKDFFYSSQGFFQNNHEMAELMQKYCNDILKSYDTPDSMLLDLYAGVGTFGIINSGLFKDVVMVESVKQSVAAGEKNISLNNVSNARFVCLDARHLKRLSFPNTFVIADPPRSGMHPDTISALNNLQPKAIAYVSCNVEQLKKDLPKFKGYNVKSAALFDFFPHTPHCEAVVELVQR
ncbi:MAG: 23S rRNA (uracil(1939)-C(5))-methyltransferase RlmD [Candidatus Woesearchaeota archaeon]